MMAGLMLLSAASAAERYDTSKEELLAELGKLTSTLVRGGREVLIYPNNVRIELEHNRVVSINGIDLAAPEKPAEPAATPPPESSRNGRPKGRSTSRDSRRRN
jgi:hypothetical protein